MFNSTKLEPKQNDYYENIVKTYFYNEQPRNLLFSYLYLEKGTYNCLSRKGANSLKSKD